MQIEAYLNRDPEHLHRVIKGMAAIIEHDAYILDANEAEQFIEAQGEYVRQYLYEGYLYMFIDDDCHMWAMLYWTEEGTGEACFVDMSSERG